MTRLWLLVALFVVAVLLFRRSLGAGSRAAKPREDRGDAPTTRACGHCGTRYDPQITGGACPRCGK